MEAPMIPDWLYTMAKDMQEQDNHGTGSPIYCVKNREPFYIKNDIEIRIPDIDFVEIVYANVNDDELSFFSSEDEVRKNALENDFDEDEIDIREYCKYEQLVTHAWFFTEKEAKDYMTQYSYRLTNPFLYVESAHNMESVKKLMEWIKTLEKPE